MTLPARTDDALADAHADYIGLRVVDTLLREDVRGCVSRAEVVRSDALPDGCADSFPTGQRWLQIAHFGSGRLWIPVIAERFMQPWRLARLPLLWEDGAGVRKVRELADILACFRAGLDEDTARGFRDFESECATALAHRQACEAERRRWFRECGTARGTELPDWHARLLHYDRLAAFLDHPFYPTARAKLGFAVEDLPQYAPEFAPSFELHWLAVPRELYHPSGEQRPPGWPEFVELGLPASLAGTHALVPVHPFLWRNDLERLLADSGLADQVLRAPRTALRVSPTLSVRTLAVCDAPHWHLKLPLTIRTLGALNIRTIKPSTIHDGDCIQNLLDAIREREAGLRERVLLTAEDNGAHVAGQKFLGFILRRYPQAALQDATLVPVAALSAPTPGGSTVVEELVARFYGGDRQAFLDDYLDLTLRWHLLLWLRYGIALESNQQNSVLVFSDAEPRLRLLLKDNDAARIHCEALARRWPALAAPLAALHDARIAVQEELPLAQMFTTITLQLNIATLIEHLARCEGQAPMQLYARVRGHVVRILDELREQGEDVTLAQRVLLDDAQLPIKYLLVAATLADKKVTGATDVNKYYGRTAPNFLRVAP